jgi:hypothetical protein
MCGVNCALAPCYRTGTCLGCRSDNHDQKRISKWKCRIRTCVLSKNLEHCGECEEVPCATRRRPDKNYREKYGIDLLVQTRDLSDLGPVRWCLRQQSENRCSDCGGTVDPYKHTCYVCGKPREK